MSSSLRQVYLRILPILISKTPGSPFSRASSFTSGPWVSSYSHVAALSSPASLPDNTAPQTSNTSPSKEQIKSSARYLFTDQEVELLTRNAEELLQLHEHFVQELRAELTPLGFLMHSEETSTEYVRCQRESIQNSDAAIRAVSTKFATEVCKAFSLWCLAFDPLL